MAREIAPSLDELFGHEVVGDPLTGQDGKSGARLERVDVGGRTYVLKHLHVSEDWVMRGTGDLGIRPVTVWRDGWLDRLPSEIDHAVVAAAWDERDGGRGAVLVMDDVADHLLPEGDGLLPLDQHRAFLHHMARLHATFWGTPPAPRLLALGTRLVLFGPRLGETERRRGGTDVVPTRLVPDGWARLAERSPRMAAIAAALHDDPTPVLVALDSTPQTFVHGDWKAGNLGSRPDGRTILLDWAVPGVAPGCLDLAWYLCLNRARLPETKEDAITAYREALEGQGIDTDPWWDRQLASSLLGMVLMFGWEKALGDAEELSWWEERALDGARLLAG